MGEYIGAAGEQEAPDRFDPSIPPGGFVCSVCGTPVESEPCREHQPVAWTNAQGSPIKLTEADPALGGPLTNVADYVVPVDFRMPDGTALDRAGAEASDLAEYFAAVNDVPGDVTRRSRNGLLVPGPGVVIERGTVDPTECRQCGEALTNGESFLCDLCTGAATITPPWRTALGPDEPIRITLPGVYELDANEYHDPAITGDWLSNSDARQLTDDGCPAQFRYDRDNGVRKTSAAFAMGHAVHARILGKGETIAVRPLVNPDDPEQVWDSWRTKASQRWKAEQESAGRSVILPEDAEIVEAMAAAVHQKPRAHALLSQPGRPEVALFWVDPVTGVRRRCLVDYLPDGPDEDGIMRPVDLKSADEVAPNGDMEKKLYDHCWHRQAVTIADGIRALGLADEVEFYFIVQSKKAPHLVTVVMLDADAERIGGIENHRALMVYKECLETDVWPDFAEDTVTLTVPQWISRMYEEEIEVSS
ncbi:MAG TPA: PD-(D/E)XK nuclease-like domain-containing protein [Umezawaea sp.]|nr:PD-(D/E)XK nuclease-like domain-containing protein [Umezawaea sp.]